MSDIYNSNLTIREKLKIEKKNKNLKIKSGCHVWTGGDLTHDGYGTFRIVFRGKRKRFKVHRINYFLNIGHSLNPQFHVSHLCHNKLCILFEHLSYEPKSVNDSRNICKNNGECIGHRGYKKCIL